MSEVPITEATGKRPSAWRRFWRGVWLLVLWLLRLIIAIGGGVLLGAAIFYVAYVGVPQFYQQVLNPIQVNTAKLGILQEDFRSTQESFNADMRTARDEIRTLRATVNDQQVTIHTLQASLDAEKENRTQLLSILQTDTREMDSAVQMQGIALGKLESDIASSKASSEEVALALAADLGSTGSELAAVSDRTTALSDALTALEEDLDSTKMSLDSLGNQLASSGQELEASAQANQASAQANEAKISSLAEETSERFASLDAGLSSLSTALSDVQIEVADISTAITMPITLADRFERRLVMMQAWQEILKARLHLLEKNVGLATQSLALAQANVAKFAALSTDLSEQQLAPIMEKVAAAAALVEEDPFVAIQELEIVWHNLELLVSAPVGEEAPAEQEVVEEGTAEGEAPAEGESVAPEEGTEGGGEAESGGEGSTEGGGSTGTGG